MLLPNKGPLWKTGNEAGMSMETKGSWQERARMLMKCDLLAVASLPPLTLGSERQSKGQHFLEGTKRECL
jgi:hypothetical protein